jgi:hypothetical protein
MGNNSRKKAAPDQKDHLSGNDRESAAALSAQVAPKPSASVVLLEARRVAKAKQLPGAIKERHEGEASVSRPSKEIGEQIGKELRELYSDLVAQPMPQRFFDLLNQLEV